MSEDTPVTNTMSMYDILNQAEEEIEHGRNREGDLIDYLYRLAIHPAYNDGDYGRFASRLVKAHVDRLNDPDSDDWNEE